MQSRIKSTNSQGTDDDIEQQFGLQLEQLIEHCKDELSLIPQMAGRVNAFSAPSAFCCTPGVSAAKFYAFDLSSNLLRDGCGSQHGNRGMSRQVTR